MNFTLILETDDATVLRGISTAAAMIEYHADCDITSPTFGLADAITTMAWIAEAFAETLGDFEEVGFDMREAVPAAVLQRLGRRLQGLATTLLAPPPTEEEKAARLAEARDHLAEVRQALNDYIASGISPVAAERHFSVGMDTIGEGDDLGFEDIPAWVARIQNTGSL